MVDYWGRFEWQHRGSPHFHFLAWFEDAPKVEAMDLKAKDEDQALACVVRYFDELLKCVNPALDDTGEGDPPEIPVNSASVPYFEVENRLLDYMGLVMFCHTHRCREGFCKKIVDGRLQECRFHFPFDLCPGTKIKVTKDDKTNRDCLELELKRNYPYVNSHIPMVARSNRSNTGAQAVLDREKVVTYCTKYVCMSEPKSQLMKDLLGNVSIGILNPGQTVRQLAQRILIRNVGDRDYWAQETVHLLMGYPQYLSSRTFVSAYLTAYREIKEVEGEVEVTLNLFDK